MRRCPSSRKIQLWFHIMFSLSYQKLSSNWKQIAAVHMKHFCVQCQSKKKVDSRKLRHRKTNIHIEVTRNTQNLNNMVVHFIFFPYRTPSIWTSISLFLRMTIHLPTDLIHRRATNLLSPHIECRLVQKYRSDYVLLQKILNLILHVTMSSYFPCS